MELIPFEKITSEIQTAGQILEENKKSLTRAADYGSSLLANLENKIDDNMYKTGLEYLGKVRKTVQTMNEKRKPITQLLTEIAKQFTTIEAELAEKGDTIPAKVKAKLDAYAAEIARKKRELELELENKRKIDLQKNLCTNECKKLLDEKMFAFLNDVIGIVNRIWSNVSLEDFDNVTAEIIDAPGKFELPYEYFTKNLQTIYQKSFMFDKISDQEIEEICKSVLKEHYPTLLETFTKNLDEAIHVIVTSFDQRYAELQQLEKASKAEAELLKKQAEEDDLKRKQEQQRQLQIAKENAELTAKQTHIAENITTLFDTAQPVNEVKVKEVTEINVISPAGFIELLLFYFEHEGNKLSIEKLEKKFGFAKKFAETKYMKDDIKINSKNLQYVETAKAK